MLAIENSINVNYCIIIVIIIITNSVTNFLRNQTYCFSMLACFLLVEGEWLEKFEGLEGVAIKLINLCETDA